MGLSNEERRAKMTWAANHLTQLASSLPDEGWNSASEKHSYKRLKDLCGQVWHAMLGGTFNGAHWLLGSSASNPIKDSESPWAVALEHHFRDSREGKGWLEEAREERHKAYEEADDKDALVSPWDEKNAEDAIAIASLLKKLEVEADLDEAYAPTALDKVFLIYAQTENMSYGLRRYPDKMLADFPKLDKLVSDIQGECFNCFQKDSRYALAYLFNQILDSHFNNYGNPIRELAIKQGWMVRMASRARERLSRHELKLDAVREWHLRIESHKVKTATDWVVLALEIMDYRASNDVKDTLRIAGKMGIELDEARVKAAYAKAAKAAEEHKKFADRDYCGESRQAHLYAVHGVDSFDACKTDEERAEDTRRRKRYIRSRSKGQHGRKAPKDTVTSEVTDPTLVDKLVNGEPSPLSMGVRKVVTRKVISCMEAGQGGYWVTPDCGHRKESPVPYLLGSDFFCENCAIGCKAGSNPPRTVADYYPNVEGYCLSILSCGHRIYDEPALTVGLTWHCEQCRTEAEHSEYLIRSELRTRPNMAEMAKSMFPVQPLPDGAKVLYTKPEGTKVTVTAFHSYQNGRSMSSLSCGHHVWNQPKLTKGTEYLCKYHEDSDPVQENTGRKPSTVESFVPNYGKGQCQSVLSCGHHVYGDPDLQVGTEWSCSQCDEEETHAVALGVSHKAKYNPKLDVAGHDCVCGDPYGRHFDGYEHNAHVGCKYCECREFQEPPAKIKEFPMPFMLKMPKVIKERTGLEQVLLDSALSAKPVGYAKAAEAVTIESRLIDTGGKTRLNVEVTDENGPVPVIWRGLTKVSDDNVQAALEEADPPTPDEEKEMQRSLKLRGLNGMTRAELLRMANVRKVPVVWNTKTTKAKMIEDLLHYTEVSK